MTDLGKNRSGPKESDNRDKSLHGLMVALAMAGAIAGSAILFAYASSAGSVSAANAAESEVPEPVIVEKVVEKPVYIERIKYINRTVEVEKPVYINRTVEVEKEVPVYIEKEVPVYIEKEVEKPVYIYVNETEDESDAPEEEQKDDDLQDEPEQPEQDTISERVMDLLHRVTDIDDDEKEEKDDDDDDENKGKGHKHDDDDDEEEGDD